MSAAEISPVTILSLLVEQEIVDPSEPLTPESDLFACGMDSLAIMQLLLHLETRFGITIAPGEMTRERFATAEALAAWLASRKLTSG